MKAEELRIGNLVLIDGETRQISGIIGELIYAHHTDAHKVLNAPDSVFGIPITEDWLIKFGFENQSEHLYRRVTNDFAFAFSITRVSNNSWAFPMFAIRRPIKFVHELQNLYFSICDEELKALEL